MNKEPYLDWRDLDTDTIEEIARRSYSACKVAIDLGGVPVAPSRTRLSYKEWVMEPALDPDDEGGISDAH